MRMIERARFFRAVTAGLLWAGLAATGAAQEPVRPAPIAAESSSANHDARYRLRSGDVLELNFPFVPDFDQNITVQPDGFITLRALGPLQVAGTTIPELTERLRAAYESILKQPVITIELKDFEKPYFIVAGEVEKPGKYDLRGETTLTQAVAVAGGTKERAKQSRAVLFQRRPDGDYQATRVDLNKMLKNADLNADVRVQPGDVVFIPRRWGNVNLPNVTSAISSLWVLSLLK